MRELVKVTDRLPFTVLDRFDDLLDGCAKERLELITVTGLESVGTRELRLEMIRKLAEVEAGLVQLLRKADVPVFESQGRYSIAWAQLPTDPAKLTNSELLTMVQKVGEQILRRPR